MYTLVNGVPIDLSIHIIEVISKAKNYLIEKESLTFGGLISALARNIKVPIKNTEVIAKVYDRISSQIVTKLEASMSGKKRTQPEIPTATPQASQVPQQILDILELLQIFQSKFHSFCGKMG